MDFAEWIKNKTGRDIVELDAIAEKAVEAGISEQQIAMKVVDLRRMAKWLHDRGQREQALPYAVQWVERVNSLAFASIHGKAIAGTSRGGRKGAKESARVRALDSKEQQIAAELVKYSGDPRDRAGIIARKVGCDPSYVRSIAKKRESNS